jgi:hypothetical protein
VSDSLAAGLGQGIGARSHERQDDEKTTLDQAERWATLLGSQLARVELKTRVAPPTAAWRESAGDLTPPGANEMPVQNAAPGSVTSSGAGDEGSEDRLIVRVDGGDLGEIALLVDRNAGAIRVTISAADAVAEAALGLERSSLRQALESRGITVDSVSVVRANNFGTLPAQRSSATRRTHDPAEAESKDEDRERRRLSRKLNLIG